ncbi:glutamate racemase [Candidatus Nitrosotenuis aquarius]|uniref:glutamate racemase n=1 Tax=Candidatus Nitrosotenuis aquarius TaxID=1846278 RepID=UPI000C1EFDF7|nr:aspartate/glutamate racemase family protein [Candidatus Nitrosotenuis aquarius]
MRKVVVFDSGLGSLSIVRAIMKTTKVDVIYFADQKNYPYGTKTNAELLKIIKHTIKSLKKKFNPSVIVIGSNTPTLLFPSLFDDKTIMGVLPPIADAQNKTKTNSIAILGSRAIITSKETKKFIQKNLVKKICVIMIDASKLIDLVESGKFLSDKKYCKAIIDQTLTKKILQHSIDVVTLSSTHLPFLLPILKKLFPKIMFLDPSIQVATELVNNKFFSASTKNSLRVFSSGDTKQLEKNLMKLKIKTKVRSLTF